MKNLRLLLIALPLLLLAVMAATYALSPQLLAWQAGRWLDQLPCTTRALAFEHPGLDRIRLSNLDFDRCRHPALARLKAREIILVYSADGLFRRRLDSVSVEGLELYLSTAKDTPSEPLPVAALLPSLWLGQLPTARLEVDIARLVRPAGDSALELRGNLTADARAVRVTLERTEGSLPVDSLAATGFADNRFELALKRAEHEYRAQGVLQIEGDRFRLEGQDALDLPLLSSWLSPHALVVDGKLSSRWQLSGPVQADPAQLLDTLQLQQTFDADLQVAGPRLGLERLEARLEGQTRLQDGQLFWQLATGSAAQLRLTPDAPVDDALPRRWRLQVDTDMEGTLEPGAEPMPRLLAGALTAWSDDAAGLALQATLSDLTWTPGGGSLGFDLHADDRRWQQQAVALDAPRLQARGRLTASAERLDIHLDAGARLAADHARHPQGQLAGLSATTTRATNLQLHLPDNRIALAPTQLTLEVDTLHAGDLDTGPVRGRLDLDASADLLRQPPDARLDLTTPKLIHPKAHATDLALSLSTHADGQRIAALYRLSGSASGARFQVDGQADADLGRGHATTDWRLSPLPLTDLWPLIKRRLPEDFEPLSAQAGRLTARGHADITPQQWRIEGRAQLAGAELKHPQWTFTGLDASLDFSATPTTPAVIAGELVLDRVQGPLAVRQLTGRFRFVPPQLSVQQAELLTLNGKVYVDPFSLDLEHPDGATNLYIERFSLAELFALHQRLSGQSYAPLSGQGVVSGILPLAWSKERFTIRGGDLRALPPGGTIRYQPLGGAEALAQANPATALAMRVVENFQFQQLSSGIDFDAEGTLRLDNTLTGSNPNWQNGQPVVLNVPVEYSGVVELYRALRYSDTLIKSLSDKVQGH